ncbi:bifunctional riboflavin kinase/FAD synthetase [Kocuria palustris]|uniref:bifunctional riboflavin kinase/FAD synthetase n=1 Tax=Kocuria palustris TaxID=71999 RepID=UPI0021B1EF28|nr:bifunctional riboflavin kinase/FAD synthetase [Kocuria palustris]
MHRLHDLSEVPEDLGTSVVTVGNFDGVHRGHQEVLGMVVDRARQEGAHSVVLTFDPHPALVHRPDQYRGQIMGTSDKLDAMEELGLDAVLVQHYDLSFAAQDPIEFMTRYLLEGLRAVCVVVGADARFGRGNEGDVNALRRFGDAHGFEVVVVDDLECRGTVPAQIRTESLPLVGVDGPVGEAEDAQHDPEDRRISSTWIRERLIEGDVEDAARLLGRAHRMRGTVVHGAARGRQLGFPTANLAPDADGYIPADGVYAGWLTDAAGQRWPVAVSVGSNPTFEGVSRVVEAHVIDRPEERIEDFDLYGQEIMVEFIARLRGMVAYEGVEKLVEQMTRDVDQTRSILAQHPDGMADVAR